MRVDIPGVGVVEFPDDMSEEQVNAAAKRLFDEANPKEQKGALGSLTGGVARSWEGTKGLVTEALPAMVQAAFGADDKARANLEAFRQRTAKAEEANPTQVDFKDLVNDFTFDKLGRFAAESIGEAIPSLATAMIPGVGGGALAARVGAGAGLKAAAEAGSAAAAKQLAGRVATGQLAGAAVGSGIQNIPESFASLNEDPTQELSVGPALIAGMMKTALDTITPFQALRKMHGPDVADQAAQSAIGKFLQTKKGAAVLGAAQTMVTEGATEGLQTFIDQVAAKSVRGEDFDPWEIASAVAKGGIGAAPLGAYASARSAGKAQQLRQQAEEARLAGEAERAAQLEALAQAAYEEEVAAEAEMVAERGRIEREQRLARAEAARKEAEAEATGESLVQQPYPGVPQGFIGPEPAPDVNFVTPEYTPAAQRMDEARAREKEAQEINQQNARRIEDERALDELGFGRRDASAEVGAPPPPVAPVVAKLPKPGPVELTKPELNTVEAFLAELPAKSRPSIPALQTRLQQEHGRVFTPGEAKALLKKVGSKPYNSRLALRSGRKAAPAQPYVGREELPPQGPSYAENPAIEPLPTDMSQAPPQNLPKTMKPERWERMVRFVESLPKGAALSYDKLATEGLVRSPKEARFLVDWAKEAGLVNESGLRVTATDRVRSKTTDRPFPQGPTRELGVSESRSLKPGGPQAPESKSETTEAIKPVEDPVSLPPVDLSPRTDMYNYRRHIEFVPISWLEDNIVPGNKLRYDPTKENTAEVERALSNEAITVSVGKNSRTAMISEGNHRLVLAKARGYTHVPVRVLMGSEWGSRVAGSDKIADDLIPVKGEYFPGDASPSEVFKSLEGKTLPIVPLPDAEARKIPLVISQTVAEIAADELGGIPVAHSGSYAVVMRQRDGRPVYAYYSFKTSKQVSLADIPKNDAKVLDEAADRHWAKFNITRRTTRDPIPAKGVVSVGVPQQFAGYARSLVDAMGLGDVRLLITTRTAKMPVELSGYYPLAERNKRNIQNNMSFITPIDKDAVMIVLEEYTTPAEVLEVIAHEVGHILEKTHYDNADQATKDAIEADFNAWLKTTKNMSAAQHIRSMRPAGAGRNRNIPAGMEAVPLDDKDGYWTSFSEWFADQTARWATTQQKPLTLVEKFFARLGQMLRQLFAAGRKEGLPVKSVAEFLDKHFKTKRGPTRAPILMAERAARAYPEGTAVRRVLDQEVQATTKDERVASIIGLTKPYERTLDQIVAKEKIFTPPPADPSARLAWWNKWINSLDYIAHKYPQLANYARVMTDRNEIAQALRKQFIELMHPLATLKNKKNVNSFAIFADALGYEGSEIVKQGDGLVLKFDPETLPEGSYLRKIAPANGQIVLNKQEAEAYNSMRKAYNLEHREVRRSLLTRYGIPEGVRQDDLWKMAAEAEEAAKAIPDAEMRKVAMQRARNLVRIAEVLRDDWDSPGFLTHYLPHVRPQGDNVAEFSATGPDGTVQYFRVDSPVGFADATRRAKDLMVKVQKRLGPEWKLSPLGQATPASLISQFRESRDISSFNTVETLVSLLKTGANETMIDEFLDNLKKLRAEVGVTGTTAARRMHRRGIEGYIHEGNYERYVEQVAADVLSRSASSIARNYTIPAHAEVLSDLSQLPSKTFLDYAVKNSAYVDSEEHGTDFIRAAAFHYTLGTNISSAVLNLMQPLQTTLPILGSIYGFGKTTTAMLKAYKDAGTMFDWSLRVDPDFLLSGKKRPLGIEPALWEDIRTFIARSGANPILSDQMGGMRGGQNLTQLEAKLGENAEYVTKRLALLFSQAEQINRITTYIAAWRLANSDKKNAAKHRQWASDSSFIGSQSDNMSTGDIASFTVDQTQYNMSKAMRPRFMQGVLGIPFQFSAYPIRTMELAAKTLFGRGNKTGMWHNPVARSSFMSLLGVMWLQAGLLGLPVVGAGADWWDEVLADKLSKLLGIPMPQIRKDLREGMAKFITEMGVFDDPVKATNIILKGPLREATGLALESRVAIDWPSPEIVSGNPLALLGPFGGAIGGGIANAAEYFSRDQNLLALSQLFPPLVRSIAKAETASPGVINEMLGLNLPPQGLGIMGPSGKSPLAPDEVDKGPWAKTLMVAGFTPAEVADRREALRSVGSKQLAARKDEVLDSLANDLVEAILFERANKNDEARAVRKRFSDKLKAQLDRDRAEEDPAKRLLLGNISAALNSRVLERLNPVQARLKSVPQATRGSELTSLREAYGETP